MLGEKGIVKSIGLLLSLDRDRLHHLVKDADANLCSQSIKAGHARARTDDDEHRTSGRERMDGRTRTDGWMRTDGCGGATSILFSLASSQCVFFPAFVIDAAPLMPPPLLLLLLLLLFLFPMALFHHYIT